MGLILSNPQNVGLVCIANLWYCETFLAHMADGDGLVGFVPAPNSSFKHFFLLPLMRLRGVIDLEA